jgi:hypothetical protein
MPVPSKASSGWSASELGIEVDEEDLKPMQYWKPHDPNKPERESWNPMPPPSMLERLLEWITAEHADFRNPRLPHMRTSVNDALRTLATLPAFPKTCTAAERRAKMHKTFVEPAEAFDPRTTGNVIFMGETGRGKTVGAAHAVFSLWQRRLAALEPLPKVLFVKHTEISNARRNSRLGQEAQLLDDAAEVEVLVIDDIGQGNDDRDTALFELVDRRYDTAKATIATTGLTVPEFETKVGEALLRRLLETKRRGRLLSTFGSPKLQAVRA